MLSTEELILLFKGGGRASKALKRFSKSLGIPKENTLTLALLQLKLVISKQGFTANDIDLTANALLELKNTFNKKFGEGKFEAQMRLAYQKTREVAGRPLWVDNLKKETWSLLMGNTHSKSPKNPKPQSAKPKEEPREEPREELREELREEPREYIERTEHDGYWEETLRTREPRRKGLRLATRARVFNRKHGELITDLKDFAKFSGAAGGLAAVGVPIYDISDAIIKYRKKERQQNLSRESRLENTVNTPTQPKNTSLKEAISNNTRESTLKNSTETNTLNDSLTTASNLNLNNTPALNNASRTAQTSRSTQSSSNKLPLNKSTNKSQNKPANKPKVSTKKKLISKSLAKKEFAKEFMNAYLSGYYNAIDEKNTSPSRDTYSEAEILKAALAKSRKDEMKKLLDEVLTLLSQINELTNHIY